MPKQTHSHKCRNPSPFRNLRPREFKLLPYVEWRRDRVRAMLPALGHLRSYSTPASCTIRLAAFWFCC